MKIGGAHESYTRETDPAGQASLFNLSPYIPGGHWRGTPSDVAMQNSLFRLQPGLPPGMWGGQTVLNGVPVATPYISPTPQRVLAGPVDNTCTPGQSGYWYTSDGAHGTIKCDAKGHWQLAGTSRPQPDVAVYGYYAPAGQAAAPSSTSPWLYALGGAIVGYLARGAMKRR